MRRRNARGWRVRVERFTTRMKRETVGTNNPRHVTRYGHVRKQLKRTMYSPVGAFWKRKIGSQAEISAPRPPCSLVGGDAGASVGAGPA